MTDEKELDGLWETVDVDPGDIWVGEWLTSSPDTGPCASLPEEDRWYAHRISRLPGDRHAQQPLFAAVARWLEAEGFDVRRYRAPLSGRLELRAHRKQLSVIAAVSTNGATTIQVFAGPGAPYVGNENPPNLAPLA